MRIHIHCTSTVIRRWLLICPIQRRVLSFGFAVEVVNDVDGDGKADFLVGAPKKDVNGYTDVGRVLPFLKRRKPYPHV